MLNNPKNNSNGVHVTLEAAQHNLYQQNTEFEIIEALLSHVKRKTFIDVGAEKGSFTLLLHSHGFKGCFFEPLPKFAPELTRIAENTNTTFFPYAVDYTDRTTDFYIASDLAGNSLDYFSSLHPLTHDERITHKKVADVTCRSLDSLLREKRIDPYYGIIKIDTEGNDLNVLKGMETVASDVLMCEYFMPGTYAGWELGHPLGLIQEAKKLGFEHYIAIKRIDEYEMVSIDNTAFVDNQWGNLIFLKQSIFDLAKPSLDVIISNNEVRLFKKILETTNILRKCCDERLNTIDLLEKICKERLEVIEKLDRINREQLDIINKMSRIGKIFLVKNKLMAKWTNFRNMFH